MWALTHVKRQSLSVSAFLSQSSITSYDGHKIFQLPRNHEVTSFFCLFLCFFLQLPKTLPLPSSCRFPPLPHCLRCSQPRPWGFTVLPTPLQKALRMFFSSTYYHLSRLHNSSLALDLNFQTVLLSPAPRFPDLSAAMLCFHLTVRILDHILNSQAPHLIPEALPELTRTSDLFSPLLRHSHLFSLNCGNSPRVLAKTHTWVQTPWLHLYFLTSQILFSYIYTIVLILWF